MLEEVQSDRGSFSTHALSWYCLLRLPFGHPHSFSSRTGKWQLHTEFLAVADSNLLICFVKLHLHYSSTILTLNRLLMKAEYFKPCSREAASILVIQS